MRSSVILLYMFTLHLIEIRPVVLDIERATDRLRGDACYFFYHFTKVFRVVCVGYKTTERIKAIPRHWTQLSCYSVRWYVRRQGTLSELKSERRMSRVHRSVCYSLLRTYNSTDFDHVLIGDARKLKKCIPYDNRQNHRTDIIRFWCGEALIY